MNGEFSLTDTCSGELQRCGDVIGLEIRIVGQQVFVRPSGSELPEQRCYGHPQVPDARQAAHAVRINGDPVQMHSQRLIRRPFSPRCWLSVVAIRRTLIEGQRGSYGL